MLKQTICLVKHNEVTDLMRIKNEKKIEKHFFISN